MRIETKTYRIIAPDEDSRNDTLDSAANDHIAKRRRQGRTAEVISVQCRGRNGVYHWRKFWFIGEREYLVTFGYYKENQGNGISSA